MKTEHAQNMTTTEIADELERRIFGPGMSSRQDIQNLLDMLRGKCGSWHAYTDEERAYMFRILAIEKELRSLKTEMKSLYEKLTKDRTAIAVRRALSRLRKEEE